MTAEYFVYGYVKIVTRELDSRNRSFYWLIGRLGWNRQLLPSSIRTYIRSISGHSAASHGRNRGFCLSGHSKGRNIRCKQRYCLYRSCPKMSNHRAITEPNLVEGNDCFLMGSGCISSLINPVVEGRHRRFGASWNFIEITLQGCICANIIISVAFVSTAWSVSRRQSTGCTCVAVAPLVCIFLFSRRRLFQGTIIFRMTFYPPARDQREIEPVRGRFYSWHSTRSRSVWWSVLWDRFFVRLEGTLESVLFCRSGYIRFCFCMYICHFKRHDGIRRYVHVPPCRGEVCPLPGSSKTYLYR